jgi:acetyltransferase-like isoleucine patch superfamily enzyme
MLYIPGTNRLFARMLKAFVKFAYFGSNVTISPSCDISFKSAPHIHIGNNVTLANDIWLNIPLEAKAHNKGHVIIKIGDNTGIGRRCTISGINKVYIGDNCIFGPNVFFSDHNHEYLDKTKAIQLQGTTEGGTIIVESGCWFGHNSAVVADRGRLITIGKNSVIGANSVVTKSCPAYSIMVGLPGRNVNRLIRSES